MTLSVRQSTAENAPAKYKFHTNEYFQISIEGVNHRMRIFDITEGLIRRGYTDEQILMILGGNFVRALEACWTVSLNNSAE